MCCRCNGEAIVWLEQTAGEVPPHDEWLGERERGVLGGLRFPKRRGDWRLGRWTAKRAVAAALGIGDMREIEILAAASGAPEAWIGEQRAPVSLSLSHSSGHALCCVAPDGIALGCDLERIEPRGASFASDYLTSEELRVIVSLPPAIVGDPHLPAAGRCGAPSEIDQTVAINLYWSAKESALKALGEGLRLDPRSVLVTLLEFESSPAGVWRPLRVMHDGGRMFKGWWQGAGDDPHICQADVGHHGFVKTVVAQPTVAAQQPIPTSARQMWGTVGTISS